jgi:antitoxin (DNA-binding transcriptional repressor) of toxin-antitoxin stability system
MIVNISEAKTNLSKLIDMVYHGEEVVIAKNNLPIVDLVIHKTKGQRKIGILEGKIDIPDDIHHGDQEIEDMFYDSLEN